MKKEFRSSQDTALYNEIIEESIVKRSIAQLKELEKSNPKQNTKKYLLSTSLRLSKIISPSLHKMTELCVEKLDIKLPVELFVYSSPQFNAACFKPEDNRLYIMFSSSILEAFTEDEICYVLGHELGHHKFAHHEVPIQFILKHNSEVTSALALKLFKWSRFAEISADRAGAICMPNFETVACALFKLSSGISNFKTVKFDIAEYINQIDELIKSHKNSDLESDLSDWFSSHPFSPLRVKALQHFFESEIVTENGSDLIETDSKVENTLSFMDPDYLRGKTPVNKACRNLFIAGAVILAHTDGEFSKSEKSALGEMLDNDLNIDALNKEALEADLQNRINKVNEKATLFQKKQILRDLKVVSDNSSSSDHKKHVFLNSLAAQLKISSDFVNSELSKDLELD